MNPNPAISPSFQHFVKVSLWPEYSPQRTIASGGETTETGLRELGNHPGLIYRLIDDSKVMIATKRLLSDWLPTRLVYCPAPELTD